MALTQTRATTLSTSKVESNTPWRCSKQDACTVSVSMTRHKLEWAISTVSGIKKGCKDSGKRKRRRKAMKNRIDKLMKLLKPAAQGEERRLMLKLKRKS